jgi:hypothetical protein
MKFIKLAVFLFVSILVISQPLQAARLKATQPEACPKAEDIISGGLKDILTDTSEGIYAIGQLNNYNTDYRWGFAVIISYDQANSEEDAMQKALASLPSLSGTPIPMAFDDTHTLCIYDIGDGYQAGALTPIDFMSHTARMMISRK